MMQMIAATGNILVKEPFFLGSSNFWFGVVAGAVGMGAAFVLLKVKTKR